MIPGLNLKFVYSTRRVSSYNVETQYSILLNLTSSSGVTVYLSPFISNEKRNVVFTIKWDGGVRNFESYKVFNSQSKDKLYLNTIQSKRGVYSIGIS